MATNKTKNTSNLDSYKLSYTGQEINDRLERLNSTVASFRGNATDLSVNGSMSKDEHAVNVGWVNKKLKGYLNLAEGNRAYAPITGDLKITGKIYDKNDNRALFTYDLLNYGGYKVLNEPGDSIEFYSFHINKSELEETSENDYDLIKLTCGHSSDNRNPDEKKPYILPKYKFANLAFLPDKLLGNPKAILNADNQVEYASSSDYGYGITDVYFTDLKDVPAIYRTENQAKCLEIRLGTDENGDPITRDVAYAADKLRDYNIPKDDTGLIQKDYITKLVIGGDKSCVLNNKAINIENDTNIENKDHHKIKIVYKGNLFEVQGCGDTLQAHNLYADFESVENGIPRINDDHKNKAISQNQFATTLAALRDDNITYKGNKNFKGQVIFEDTATFKKEISGCITESKSLTISKSNQAVTPKDYSNKIMGSGSYFIDNLGLSSSKATTAAIIGFGSSTIFGANKIAQAHELAFTTDGNFLLRTSTSQANWEDNNSWGEWKEVAFKNDLDTIKDNLEETVQEAISGVMPEIRVEGSTLIINNAQTAMALLAADY